MLRCFLLLPFLLSLHARELRYGNGDVHAEFHVECRDSSMMVFFNKSRLDSRSIHNQANRQYDIYFKNTTHPDCRTNKNETQNHGDPVGYTSGFGQSIWLNASFPNGCGLAETVTGDHIVYSQVITIRYGLNPSPNIIREEFDHYTIKCVRPHTLNVKIEGDYYNVTRIIPVQPEKNSTGAFSFKFEHSDINGTQQNQYRLGDHVRFSVKLNAITNVKNVIQECWSSNNGSKLVSQALIRQRCPIDSSTTMISTTQTETVFSVEAYRALGLSSEMIYVTCAVRICVPESTASDCKHCNENTRRRRDTGSLTSSGKMAVIKLSSGFFIIGDEDTTVVVIDPPTGNQGEQTNGETSFIEGPGGMTLIAIIAGFVLVVFGVIIKMFFFGASASAAITKGPAPSVFVNEGIEY